MHTDPMAHFERWYPASNARPAHYPSSVALATSTGEGEPSLRMVLVKTFGAGGFVFYTNLESRKGGEIAANPKAALCFDWPHAGRRVQVEGLLTPVTVEEADAYFNSRPYFSRLGAWASRQSRTKPFAQALWPRLGWELVWRGWRLERPPHWSGFRLQPLRLRFDEAGEQTHYLRATLQDPWHSSCFTADSTPHEV